MSEWSFWMSLYMSTYVFTHGIFLSTITCQHWLIYLNAWHWWELMYVCLKAFGQTWYISVSHHVSFLNTFLYTGVYFWTFLNTCLYTGSYVWHLLTRLHIGMGMNVYTYDIFKYENMYLRMGHCWILTFIHMFPCAGMFTRVLFLNTGICWYLHTWLYVWPFLA